MGEEKTWRWDCWHDRPKLGFKFILSATKSLWDNKKHIRAAVFFPLISGYYLFTCLMYWITLPFAFINEWARGN